MKFLLPIVVLLLTSTATAQDNATGAAGGAADDTTFDNCEASAYYAGLMSSGNVTEAAVRELVTATHRAQLSTVGDTGSDTVYDALVDLDPGTPRYDEANRTTVHLYMRDKAHRADQVNLNEGWKRGDLWPLSRGAGLTTPAATDVHAKRPTDWTVDEALKEFWWGTCGNHQDAALCISPAVPEETAPDTYTDGKIKTPPADVRGDVARSVLYQALRYGDELGLRVTDCPPFAITDYGYLSELLLWHAQDPVSEEELQRNDRACSHWQGNRNPFVDYPDLVTSFYGEPDVIVEGTYKFSKCVEPTMSPTATPNDCSSILPGDVHVIIFNSDPVDQIVLFPLLDIPETVGSLFVTDQAWNGTDFVTDEGTIEYSIPEGGVKAGKVFGYNVQFPDDKGTWETVDDSTFDLSTTGPDSILVYCLNADDEPHFIHAMSYNGGFSEPGLASYTPGETANPAATEVDGAVALPFFSNYLYEGPREGDRTELIAAFKDPANYKGSATSYDIVTSGAATASLVVSAMAAIVAVILV